MINKAVRPATKTLVDSYGRRVRKLRISLTDKCNLRCHYCMPIDSTFMDEKRFMSPIEYASIVEELCQYGLEEVRLTGGEPLMRKSFREIVEGLAPLPLRKIGLTTNAVLLHRHFDNLKENRVQFLNVSLDSLKPERFAKITNGPHLPQVLANIERARELGFSVKINVVAMRGVNDDEVFDFMDLSRRLDVEVRFLELMRIGFAREKQIEQFISAKELVEKIRERADLKMSVVDHDSTSFNYISGDGARVGFIASESQAFCGACSRWRLSADGTLRACLLKDDGLSIRETSTEQRGVIFQKLLGMKPALRPREVEHQMNTIGG